MAKTGNIIASTAAAAALATGVYIATDNQEVINNTPSQEVIDIINGTLGTTDSEFKIDWNEYLPNMDQYIPEIPSVEVPNVDIPNIDEIELSTSINMTDYIDLSDYEVQEILLTVPNVSMDFADLSKMISMNKNLQKYFKDQRSVSNDSMLLLNPYLDEWINIYNKYNNMQFHTIDKLTKFRMITEVRLPNSSEQFNILENNLLYYKSRKYDSVLITFDGTENPSDLKYLSKYIKSKGFRTFFAFSGKEKLTESVFVNPKLLKDQLIFLASECEGFLIGWRRTSAHLLEQDDAFMNYMISAVRSSNKNCIILGEIYYGNTHKYDEVNRWGFGMNIPKCSSVIMINNFGFSSVNIDAVVKKLIPSKVGNKSFVGVVVGQRPYYLTTNKNGLSQQKNQEIKEYIENKFMKSGCVGTITLHDDGKDISDKFNNNLSSTPYTILGN